MKLLEFGKQLLTLQPLKVFEKVIERDGVTYELLGLARYGGGLRLFVLFYDEAFAERWKTAEQAEPNPPRTNRELLRAHGGPELRNVFQRAEHLVIGEAAFTAEGCETRRCGTQDFELAATLGEFFKRGWKPGPLGSRDLEDLFLTSLTFEGCFSDLPVMDRTPAIRLTTRAEHVSQFVEAPLTLAAGDGPYQKLCFWDQATGQEHWAQINRVELVDPWAESESIFDSLKNNDSISLNDLKEQKTEFQRNLLELCPRGLSFPAVEYECEAGLSLQFYTRAWLEEAPVRRSFAMGFLRKAERETGILGFPLQTNLIQVPVPKSTQEFDAELFSLLTKKYPDSIIL